METETPEGGEHGARMDLSPGIRKAGPRFKAHSGCIDHEQVAISFTETPEVGGGSDATLLGLFSCCDGDRVPPPAAALSPGPAQGHL